MKKKLLSIIMVALLCSCARVGTVSKVKSNFSNSTKADMVITSNEKKFIIPNANHFIKNEKVKEGQTVKFTRHKIVKIIK